MERSSALSIHGKWGRSGPIRVAVRAGGTLSSGFFVITKDYAIVVEYRDLVNGVRSHLGLRRRRRGRKEGGRGAECMHIYVHAATPTVMS